MTTEDLLMYAREGDLDEVRGIVDGGVDVNESDGHGNTALHMACANGHSDVATLLCGIPRCVVNAQNDSGNTPLHWACLNGRTEVVKVLLEHGADITIENLSGRVPILDAADAGHRAVVDVLVRLSEKGTPSGDGGVAASTVADAGEGVEAEMVPDNKVHDQDTVKDIFGI